MNEWTHASASQITLYRRCNRKWWFNKIQGLPIAVGKAAELGKEIHRQLENYFRYGIMPQSPVARVGIEGGWLPAHDTDEFHLHVEAPVELHFDSMPVKVIGFSDLVMCERHSKWSRATDWTNKVSVLDHKTTSNFKYCKSEEELRGDPQAIIYGLWALCKFEPASDVIEFTHLYYNTKSPACRKIQITLDRGELEEAFARIVEDLHRMDADANSAPEAVAANAAACSDYGGCPFRARCAQIGDAPQDGLAALIQSAKTNAGPDKRTTEEGEMKMPFNKNNESAFSKLLRRRKEQSDTTAVVETPPEAPQVPTQGVNPPDGTPMDEPVAPPAPKRGRPPKGPFLSDGRPARSLKKGELVEAIDKEFDALHKRGLFSTLQSEHMGPEMRTWVQLGTPEKGSPKRDALLEMVGKIAAVLEPVPATEPATEPAPAKARVKKVQKSTDSEPQAAQVEGRRKEAEEAPPKPEPVHLEDSPDPGDAMRDGPDTNGSITLYIGCHPRNTEVTYLEDLLRPFQHTVARDAVVSHYSCIPYSEGPKRVAGLVLNAVESGNLTLPSHIVADRRFPGVDAVLEVLIQRSETVVERLG
jgi:hypothetical protein